MQNRDVVERCDIQHDAGLLHLVVEFSRSDARDLYVGIKQPLERLHVIAIHICFNVAPVGDQLQTRAAHRRKGTDDEISRMHRGPDRYQNTVPLSANQLVKRCGNCRRRRAVTEKLNAAGDNQRLEARLRLAMHQKSISWKILSTPNRPHKNANPAVLDEKKILVGTRIRHRCFKGDGERLTGLCVRKLVNGLK